MLNSPSNIEELLGVDQVRVWIAAKCRSEEGADLVNTSKFSNRFDNIKLWLDQTSEMVRLIGSQEVPNRHFYDLGNSLIRIKIQGSYLEGDEYLTLANSVRALDQWLKYLSFNSEQFASLYKLGQHLNIDPAIATLIDNAVDEQGNVRDSASQELGEIRTRLARVERSARSSLHRILKKSIKDEFSVQESQVTLRDGRLVIPVKAEYKRNIAGLVHDESATGQTVYLEPAEALELNNEVRELKNLERREVIQVLTNLADGIRVQYDDLIKGSKFLARMDFIYAKAAWALEFNACVPVIQKHPSIVLNQAIHPILWQAHQASNKPVIPLDISIDQNQRMIVVSGPNAGGKSVVLKTVGLLQYLIQCGIPVPVQENSTFGIFNEILLDIGDTQSIEDDLSTYSAHLTSMKTFVTRSSKRSLVLIDEFGKGTEPQFGGAIAESVLENLIQSGAYGVVTTHYQNLKDLADRTKGMENAAMKYDLGQLQPLFVLEIGQPGSSFAFEIASKIGLPKELILNAKSKMSRGQVDFDQSLNELEKEKQKFSKMSVRLEKEQKTVSQLRKDYDELKELLQEEKKAMIKEAKGEAKRIVQEANKTVEKTIRDIKENQADKRKTSEARKRLQEFDQKIKIPKPAKRKPDGLAQGDYVKLSGHDGVGQVLSIKKQEAQVQFGLLTSFVKLDRLTKTKAPKQNEISSRMGGFNKLEKFAEFSHELTIRGMRAEEALPSIDSFVDEAILLGVDRLKVVHGKGHGILRDLLRNHLSDHPQVTNIEDEHADRGGSGISIVTLK